MFEKFKPTWIVDSIYEIEPSQLKKRGFKVVLTDLDNTLIAWNHPDATSETVNWMKWMKEEGISVVIISNNGFERVKTIADSLEVEFVSNAKKPFQKGFKSILTNLGYRKDEILMVGDQLFTDIFGANRFKIKSVLVNPIVETDAWNTRLNRYMELRMKKRFVKGKANNKWGDFIDD